MRIFIITFTLLVFISPALHSKQKCKTLVVKPCKPGSENYENAVKNLKEIVKKTRELPMNGDPQPLYNAIVGLLDGPCFRVGHSNYLEKPSSATELKEWMFGRYGDSWMWNFIRLGQPAEDQVGGDHWLATMPEMPSSLTLEDEPDNSLSIFLCSAVDADCGQATRGWKHRARRVFREFARELYEEFEGSLPDKDMVSKTCRKKKRKFSSISKFENWVSCVAGSILEVEDFPVGEYKAPQTGWLLIKGRRGHYGFCDSIRAYDLETGATYVADSCSELELVEGGSIDMDKTDKGRVLASRAGTLPVDNLREAAWMLLMSDKIQRPEKISAEFFRLPQKLPIQLLESNCLGGLGGFASSYSRISSANTRLAWSYMSDGRSIKSGRLTWPRDLNHASFAHAADLLRIAEMAMTDDPPQASLPEKLDFGHGYIGVSRIDTTQESLTDAYQVLLELLHALGRKGRPYSR